MADKTSTPQVYPEGDLEVVPNLYCLRLSNGGIAPYCVQSKSTGDIVAVGTERACEEAVISLTKKTGPENCVKTTGEPCGQSLEVVQASGHQCEYRDHLEGKTPSSPVNDFEIISDPQKAENFTVGKP